MNARLIALSLLLVAGLGTCGAEPASNAGAAGEGPGPDDAVTSGPLDPDAPGGGAQLVTPRPGMTDLHAVRIDSFDVAPNDRTVTVRFVSGVEPCYVLDHVELEYTDKAVRVGLFEGSDPSGTGPCPELAVYKKTEVTLDEELAGRRLVDASTRS